MSPSEYNWVVLIGNGSSRLLISQGVTTKAQFVDCDTPISATRKPTKTSATTTPCEMETGYYLSPKEPCLTYTSFGRLPSLDISGRNIVCVRPGKLTDAFGISVQLQESTTLFVDKSNK